MGRPGARNPQNRSPGRLEARQVTACFPRVVKFFYLRELLHMPVVAPPSTLHPMKDFNPSEPAILHDRISDTIITWSGEEAIAFRSSCVAREDGSVAWKGYLFDGWGNVLGG